MIGLYLVDIVNESTYTKNGQTKKGRYVVAPAIKMSGDSIIPNDDSDILDHYQ
jgi:hypothetical protein